MLLANEVEVEVEEDLFRHEPWTVSAPLYVGGKVENARFSRPNYMCIADLEHQTDYSEPSP
jgi:hypothetical protein